LASRYVFFACLFSRCSRVQPPTSLCADAPYTFVLQRFRYSFWPGNDRSRKASIIINHISGSSEYSRLTSRSYDNIYHPGIVLWLLGVCLKMLFGQNTNIGTYLGALLVEGWGIGCVFQPGTVYLTHACFYKTIKS
jgi:hypothetical protein